VFDSSSTSHRNIDFTKTVWKRQARRSPGELRSEAPHFLQQDFWPRITPGIASGLPFITRAESRRHRQRNAAATNSLRCRFVVCDDPTCMKALSFLPPGKRRSRPYGNCRERLPVKLTSAVLFAFLGMCRVMIFWHSSIKFTPTSPFVGFPAFISDHLTRCCAT
jgi:hypothetical protein